MQGPASPAFGQPPGDPSPPAWGEWVQAELGHRALGSSAPVSANKSADSAGITAILRFQNFLPPLPKHKGTFVLNTELEHGWAPCRAPCGIWFLATVHVFIMMGEGKEGSCSYQHANNLLQRTGASEPISPEVNHLTAEKAQVSATDLVRIRERIRGYPGHQAQCRFVLFLHFGILHTLVYFQ